MAEKLVLAGVLPEVVAIGPGEQVTWLSESAAIRVEFDSNRCPFGSNVFQAPAGMQVTSGPARPGTKPGAYKYRVSLNDTVVATAEVFLREK
jgi:hypothetical protein